jgi:nitrate reductase gamma subunit
MMEAEIAGALAQFGVAGLVGWMWLAERRSAAGRERQLAEAHDRLMAERERAETLVGIISTSTRAMTAVEVSQRELARVVERLVTVLGSGSARLRAAGPREAG